MNDRLSRQPSRRSWPCWVTGASGGSGIGVKPSSSSGRNVSAHVVAQLRRRVTPGGRPDEGGGQPAEGVVEGQLGGHRVVAGAAAVKAWRYRRVWTWSRSANIRPLVVQPLHLAQRPVDVVVVAAVEDPVDGEVRAEGGAAEAGRRRRRSGGPSAVGWRRSAGRRTATARPCTRRRSGRARTSGCRRPRGRACGSTSVKSIDPSRTSPPTSVMAAEPTIRPWPARTSCASVPILTGAGDRPRWSRSGERLGLRRDGGVRRLRDPRHRLRARRRRRRGPPLAVGRPRSPHDRQHGVPPGARRRPRSTSACTASWTAEGVLYLAPAAGLTAGADRGAASAWRTPARPFVAAARARGASRGASVEFAVIDPAGAARAGRLAGPP